MDARALSQIVEWSGYSSSLDGSAGTLGSSLARLGPSSWPWSCAIEDSSSWRPAAGVQLKLPCSLETLPSKQPLRLIWVCCDWPAGSRHCARQEGNWSAAIAARGMCRQAAHRAS